MSDISISDSINMINGFLSENGIDRQISSDELISIFENNCADDNLTMDCNDFIDAIYKEFGIDEEETDITVTAGISALAMKIVGTDGDSFNISYEDLYSIDTSLSNDYLELSTESYNSSKNYVNNDNYTPTVSTNSAYGIVNSEGNLALKSVEDLQSERTTVASDLATAQNELTTAKKDNNDEVVKAENNVTSTKQRYDEKCNALAAADEEFKELNDQKTDIDNQISDQKDVISTCETQIQETNALLNKLKASQERCSAEEPSQSDYTTISYEGAEIPNTAAYNAAHSAWEAQMNAINDSIQTAEENLAQMQEQLIQEENALTQLEEDAAKIDTQISDYVQNASGQLAKDVKDAFDEYNAAQFALETAKTNQQSDVAQASQKVDEYQQQLENIDAAILRAQARTQDQTNKTNDSAEWDYVDRETTANLNSSVEENLAKMGFDISKFERLENNTYARYNQETGSNEYIALVRDNDGKLAYIHTINAPYSAAAYEGDQTTGSKKGYTEVLDTSQWNA